MKKTKKIVRKKKSTKKGAKAKVDGKDMRFDEEKKIWKEEKKPVKKEKQEEESIEDKAKRLSKAGLTTREVGAELGCCTAAASRYIKSK